MRITFIAYLLVKLSAFPIHRSLKFEPFKPCLELSEM